MATKEPIRVCISGAAGQICYSLIFLVARGEAFGKDQPVILQLLDIPYCEKVMQGVVMEIADCAFPLVQDVIGTTDANVAFKDCDYAILVGAFPRKQGMLRKDLLAKNVPIFKGQGKAISDNAKKSVRVLVVGNPANTNALIAATCAESIPNTQFTALTMLDHNRARTQLAKKAGVAVSTVKNVTIWGNHSKTQYPDASNALIGDKKATELCDAEWLKGEFITTVQQRGAAIIAARKLSSAASAAKAIVDHVHYWHFGTAEGETVSMGIYSDGSYGIQEGLIYSHPVTIKDGKISVVQGLAVSDFARTKLQETEKELAEEKATAFELLGLKQ